MKFKNARERVVGFRSVGVCDIGDNYKQQQQQQQQQQQSKEEMCVKGEATQIFRFVLFLACTSNTSQDCLHRVKLKVQKKRILK